MGQITNRNRKYRFLKFLSLFLLVFLTAAISYIYGAHSYPRNTAPIIILKAAKEYLASKVSTENYDAFGRLVKFPGKIQIACPPQTQNTGVILAIGQSNSANHATKRFTTQYPQKVFNYFDGNCYVASSPLLGASGDEGEFITLTADKLIKDDIYQAVVIVSSGIAGSPISRWQADGDLNEMLLATLRPLQSKYKVTDIIWHQGESDFGNSTSSKVYRNSFDSLLQSLEKIGLFAPAYVAVTTKCGPNPNWKLDSPTAIGQKSLANGTTIFLAANTDALLTRTDRRENDCHLSESGQIKVSTAYADAIEKHRKGK